MNAGGGEKAFVAYITVPGCTFIKLYLKRDVFGSDSLLRRSRG